MQFFIGLTSRVPIFYFISSEVEVKSLKVVIPIYNNFPPQSKFITSCSDLPVFGQGFTHRDIYQQKGLLKSNALMVSANYNWDLQGALH